MKKLFILTLIVLLFVLSSRAAVACPGQPNENPINTDAPTLVASTANGKLYTVVDNTNHTLYILHAFGTPYEWGLAHGQLLKEQVKYIVEGFLDYIEATIGQYLKFMPQEFAKIVEEVSLDAALDLEFLLCKKYIDQYWLDEMKGLSDGSGVDYNDIVRIHMLPELIKAGCSMFGAWGSATPNKGLTQLRALDWDVEGPLQEFPLVIVRHPDTTNSSNGHPFATLGWAGWIAALTGMSSVSMGVSEKVGDDFGKDSREGIPFHFLMRDILQFDKSLDDATDRMINAKRTCSVYIGVGDQKANDGQGDFKIFEYYAAGLNIWSNENQPNVTGHPAIDQIVYRGVDQTCLADLLEQYHGEVTAPLTIESIIPLVETGNLHAALYDFRNNYMYVGNALPVGESGPANAYQRQFIRLDMTAAFAEQL